MDVGKLFTFDGRIGRRAFWGLGIFQMIVSLIATVMMGSEAPAVAATGAFLLVAALFSSLATGTKRWHDRNKSGFWAFIGLIPILGGIWIFVEQGCLAGTVGRNRYGTPSSGSPFGSSESEGLSRDPAHRATPAGRY